MTTINDLSVANSFSPDDKVPLWQNANGVTVALPLSVLTGEFLTTDDVYLFAASPATESFVSGTGFNPGVTTTLTLANQYVSTQNIEVFFDTGFQGPENYTLFGTTLVFSSPIPVGIQTVYVHGGAIRQLGAPSAGTVYDATVATGTKLFNRINDTVSVHDTGATGNGTSDDTVSILNAIGNGVLAELPPGVYLVNAATGSAAITLDYSGLTTDPGPVSNGMGFRGRNPRQSALLCGTPGMYALRVQGNSTGTAGADIYDSVENFSIAGVSGANGLYLFCAAFGSVRNVVIESMNVGMFLESTLSYLFDNLSFVGNNNGIVATKGAGFSNPNSLTFNNCQFRINSQLGYSGNSPHANLLFSGGSFQGNGAQGNLSTGGIALNFDGSEGNVGARFDSIYFEFNAGQADVILNNTGANYVTVVLTSCNFNRISSGKYTVNNIHTQGKIRLLLMGCTFNAYGSYVEDPSRLYVSGDSQLKVTCISCEFGSTAAQGTLANIDG